MAETTKGAEPVAYSIGLCCASVCVPKDWDKEQTEEWMNVTNPTGVQTKWQVSSDKTFKAGQPNPCSCEEWPDTKRHWLLNC